MMRMALSRIVLGVALVTITAGLICRDYPAFSAEDPSTDAGKMAKSPKGRLPPYYAKVVSEEQRKKIYIIQEEYRQKIETARAQLNALVKEQQEKIYAVLSDEQKKKIEEAQSASRAKKSESKTEDKKNNTPPTAEKPAESKSDKSIQSR